MVAVVLATTLSPVLTTTSNARPATAERAQAASCTGFKNRVGITSQNITLANVSDLTGPVPGLYAGTRDAVRAYVRYFNATSSICGRKLKMLALDGASGTTSNKSAYVKACAAAFAAVGSASIGDAGGAAKAAACGIPDLRALFSSSARYTCATCFATSIDQPGAYENAVPDYFEAHHQAQTDRAGQVYLNAPPWASRATAARKAAQARGWSILRVDPVDVAEFNYAPRVTQMKQQDIRIVQVVGPAQNAIRLLQAMNQINYHPIVVLDPESFTAPVAAEPAAAGVYVPINSLSLTAATSNAELLLYKKWLKVVAPNAKPTLSGLFAWSSARLFTQRALALGGKLNRPNLVAGVKTVHSWNGRGMHAPQDVGAKANSNCWRIMRLGGGSWSNVSGPGYLCSGKTS